MSCAGSDLVDLEEGLVAGADGDDEAPARLQLLHQRRRQRCQCTSLSEGCRELEGEGEGEGGRGRERGSQTLYWKACSLGSRAHGRGQSGRLGSRVKGLGSR
eukprot:3938602-Rhodomonas_salina.1